jgi:hypothetical protein
VIIPLPALDSLIEPCNAVALWVFLAFELNQAFSGHPVAADFGLQVAKQFGLVDGRAK